MNSFTGVGVAFSFLPDTLLLGNVHHMKKITHIAACHQLSNIDLKLRDGLTWDTVVDCKINWTYGGPGEKQN